MCTRGNSLPDGEWLLLRTALLRREGKIWCLSSQCFLFLWYSINSLRNPPEVTSLLFSTQSWGQKLNPAVSHGGLMLAECVHSVIWPCIAPSPPHWEAGRQGGQPEKWGKWPGKRGGVEDGFIFNSMGNKIPKFDYNEVGWHWQVYIFLFSRYTLINKYNECCIFLAALNSTMLPKKKSQFQSNKSSFNLANS